MALDWAKHLKHVGEEIRIIGVYSVIIAVFSLSLQFIQWDFDMLISLIHLLVLFAIAHTEDRTTVDLPWPDLMTRFVTATIVHFCSRKAALALKSSYLSDNLSTYDTDKDRAELILLSIVVEYLDTLRFVSSARIYILAVIIIIFAAPVVTSIVQEGFAFVGAVGNELRRLFPD